MHPTNKHTILYLEEIDRQCHLRGIWTVILYLEGTDRRYLLKGTWVANHHHCLEAVQATTLCVGSVHWLVWRPALLALMVAELGAVYD